MNTKERLDALHATTLSFKEGGAKLPLDWLLSPEPDEETLEVLERLVSLRITKLVFS